jgi:hypothetical protein
MIVRRVDILRCKSVLMVFLTAAMACGWCSVPAAAPPPKYPTPRITALFSHALLLNEPVYYADNLSGLDGMRLDDAAHLKSPGKAALLSLVLPGAGQTYVGAVGKSRLFYSAEAVAWVAYGGFKIWERHKEDEFQSYAAEHAGIDRDGKSDYFWQMMTYYDSRREYEIYGRAGQPERPSYPDVVGWDWQWNNQAARTEYRQLRNEAKGAARKVTFTLGALVLNRIVAAFDAYREAKSFNRKKAMGQTGTKVRLKGSPFGENPNVMVFLQRVF